ncbi:MAG TPA: cytochrome P450 [Hyphomicrobiaceae bacterium]|nr:cytochrome P450 [Hyphomicrobiaceae bacterium]
MLAARDPETGEGPASEKVRDQAATLIFGGFETTARLLFCASNMLALDPEEQARVRAEVRALRPGSLARLDELDAWPRLRMALLEALRPYPPVPHLVREPRTADIIKGEAIPAKCQVWASPWVMHRHRAHWRHPTAFMPDRFAGQISPWTTNGAYFPFGAGPRICIAAVFAMAEAEIVLAWLSERYRMSLDDARPALPVGRLTIEPSRAPAFRLERA